MSDGKPPLTKRQSPEWAGAAGGSGQRLAILAATAATLAVLGPFGTFKDFSFALRLAYWGGLIFCGALVFEASIRLAFRSPLLATRHWRAAAAVAIAFTATAQTGAVWVVEQALRPPLPISIVELYAYVLVVTLLASAAPLWRALSALGLLSAESPPSTEIVSAEEAVNEPAPKGPARPAFLRRIPARLTGELMALEMEDHYLRVHTEDGSDLLLMRLRDAVAELAGADGMQTHRSYWVAAAAVTGVERDADGRTTLILRNGMRVPVSRSRLGAARAAGWLDHNFAAQKY